MSSSSRPAAARRDRRETRRHAGLLADHAFWAASVAVGAKEVCRVCESVSGGQQDAAADIFDANVSTVVGIAWDQVAHQAAAAAAGCSGPGRGEGVAASWLFSVGGCSVAWPQKAAGKAAAGAFWLPTPPRSAASRACLPHIGGASAASSC